jgi:hypothetical protein
MANAASYNQPKSGMHNETDQRSFGAGGRDRSKVFAKVHYERSEEDGSVIH